MTKQLEKKYICWIIVQNILLHPPNLAPPKMKWCPPHNPLVPIYDPWVYGIWPNQGMHYCGHECWYLNDTEFVNLVKCELNVPLLRLVSLLCCY